MKRAFTKIFTNELATKFSWTGFRQNQALQNLNIVNIIKSNLSKFIYFEKIHPFNFFFFCFMCILDTAINTFQAKESDFENHVKDWFRHALQRFKREKKIKT